MNNIYLNTSIPSDVREWAYARREAAKIDAQNLRDANKGLNGLLKTTDGIQKVEEITYYSATIGGNELKSLVRVAPNGTVFYPLPFGSELIKEERSEVTATNERFVQVSMAIKDVIGVFSSPISNILDSTFSTVQPDSTGTIYTMPYISQNGITYHASFKSYNDNIIDYHFWNSYNEKLPFDFRLPNLIYSFN